MLVSGGEMRALEEAAFARGVFADALMEQAGGQIARAVRQWFPHPGTALVFYGKGNNGGDALVAARHLAGRGWRIVQRGQETKLSELTQAKLLALGATDDVMSEARPLVVLDGLLGIGAHGPLREDLRVLTREINGLRHSQNAHVFAIDLPTGIDADSGEADPDCVRADFTLTIGFAKRGLIADGATDFVGRLGVLPLADLEKPKRHDEEIATPGNLAGALPRRNFETHKTEYGRVAIVAGSVGFTGAALLAAQGAVRGGAGLVSLYARREIQPALAAGCIPEVMVQPVDSYRELLDAKFSVLAIGPGLGDQHAAEILELIEHCEAPMVVDADALNALAKSRKMDVLKRCRGPRLLTPHPGEMARLFEIGPRTRCETVRAFTEEFPVTLLLKGARTVIGEKGRPLSYNSTGSPGMATGGMGDVLTGVCAALAGQHLSFYDAARLGAWLCGRAAELAISHGRQSEESLAASDVPAHLGAAFTELRDGCF